MLSHLPLFEEDGSHTGLLGEYIGDDGPAAPPLPLLPPVERPGLRALGFLLGEYAGLDGEYAGLLGEYAGLDGEYAGLEGEYAGLDGEYAGLLGEYAGLLGE